MLLIYCCWWLKFHRHTLRFWRETTKVASGEQPGVLLCICQSWQEVVSTGDTEALHTGGGAFCGQKGKAPNHYCSREPFCKHKYLSLFGFSGFSSI